MIKVLSYNKKAKLGNADYTFEDFESLPNILHILTPKFEGNWVINMIDPKLKDTKDVLSQEQIPEYVDLYIYLAGNKYASVIKEFPKYYEKVKTSWEIYQELLADLVHPLNMDATRYLYKVAHSDIDTLREVLRYLDAKCTRETITLKDVQKEISFSPRVYTTQVLRAFLCKQRYRYNLYAKWQHELGTTYAYYSMRKQLKLLLHEKRKYLNNEDTKNSSISKIDGISLSVLYALFSQTTSPMQLDSVIYQFDHMTQEEFQHAMEKGI